MPLDVLYFTDTTGYGGAEQALLTLMTGLDRKRYCPALVCHPSPGIAPLLERVRESGIPIWMTPHMPEGTRGALRLPAFTLKLVSRRATVFHAHLTWPRACKYGLMGAVLARVPVVVATEHLFVDVPYNRGALMQQRLITRGVDRYITVSTDLLNRLHQTYHIPLVKMQVIHNAVPDAASKRGPERECADDGHAPAPWGTSTMPVVLTVARLDRQKGHRYLLEAATQVPHALFVLAGDGPERAQLESYVEQLGIRGRVVFLGLRSDIPNLLAQCDLFVLPSLYEGLPISVLEAMAAEKPVVATAIGGTNEAVVDGESGVLVPPRDPRALAQAVCMLLNDPPYARRLAAAGRLRVQALFSAPVMVRQVTQLYESLLPRSLQGAG